MMTSITSSVNTLQLETFGKELELESDNTSWFKELQEQKALRRAASAKDATDTSTAAQPVSSSRSGRQGGLFQQHIPHTVRGLFCVLAPLLLPDFPEVKTIWYNCVHLHLLS
jgi:hypothetical protein